MRSQQGALKASSLGLANPGPVRLSAILQAVLAGTVMGVLVVVFVISFGAIIYGGALASDLSRGLGMTLLGATIMAVVGAFTVTYRGSIVQPQDVTTVILSTSVAAIAAGWTGTADGLFATVVLLVAVTSALTGALAYVAGRVHLGFMVRFMPYPVLGGFLAATGLLILFGAAGMAAGRSVDLWSLGQLFEVGAPVRWLPWFVYGLALVVIVRRFRHWLVLPGCLAAGALAFYLLLWMSGGSLESASAAGLLLGPFEGQSLAAGLGFWVLAEADWSTVLGQAPTMLTVAGMAIIGALLNASALGLAIDQDINPDRDLRGIGLANLGGALGGGLVGYHMLTPTIFARTLGLTSAACGVAIACFAAATLFFGAGFLSVLPVGVFAGVLFFIALDMLYTWLWEERRKLPARDFGIVLLIMAVAATAGFLQAIGVGLLAASLLFIVAYCRVDIVRLRSTSASLRSRVERAEPELLRLAEVGHSAVVYQLSGYLFFGTASQLIQEIRSGLADPARRPRFVILDFRRVSGIDASATFALIKLAKTCSAQEVELLFTGLSEPLRAEFLRANPEEGKPLQIAHHLDDALQTVEECLLATGGSSYSGVDVSAGFLEELERLHPGFGAQERFSSVEVGAGQELFAQNSPPDGMGVLVSGRLRAEISGQGRTPVPVATMRPGALVGEIGLYANLPRTARVVAEEASRVLVVTRKALDELAATDPAVLADFHRLAAIHLARRLMRTNALLRDAEAS